MRAKKSGAASHECAQNCPFIRFFRRETAYSPHRPRGIDFLLYQQLRPGAVALPFESQPQVIAVTAWMFAPIQNANWRLRMPILMVALIALAAFGLIGLMLALAVTMEQKKSHEKAPRKVA